MRTSLAALLITTIAMLLGPQDATAGCGCDKAPPPRVSIRPFVAYADQTISIFHSSLSEGRKYDVQFETAYGWGNAWSRAKAIKRKDFADRQRKNQIRVRVPNLPFGPCKVTVWEDGRRLATFTDDKLTITGRPLQVHEFTEAVNKPTYRAGVDRFGTIYIPVDVSQVSNATRFTGAALGFPVTFGAVDVVMYNEQGFLMQMLDPKSPGLFDLYRGEGDISDVLSYWRHEFRTYKEQHRWADRFATSDDEEWHDDGTPHIEHDRVVVAITGRMANGYRPAPGATPPFQLIIMSDPEERN
ncbi:MAG: hypothetical protein KIT14_06100 [bacterium]|nr:hypothetical protein [bacterium]